MTGRTLARCGLVWRSRRITIAIIASGLLLGAIPGAAQLSPSVTPPLAIEIVSERITAFDVRDPSLRQFGLLEFRGGLVLRSPHPGFGGISAIRVASDGAHFIVERQGLVVSRPPSLRGHAAERHRGRRNGAHAWRQRETARGARLV